MLQLTIWPDEVLLLIGVKSNLANMPQAWRDDGIPDDPGQLADDQGCAAVLRSTATPSQKAVHTRKQFAYLVQLPALWATYAKVAGKRAKKA